MISHVFYAPVSMRDDKFDTLQSLEKRFKAGRIPTVKLDAQNMNGIIRACGNMSISQTYFGLAVMGHDVDEEDLKYIREAFERKGISYLYIAHSLTPFD